jgi:hypothetical protein
MPFPEAQVESELEAELGRQLTAKDVALILGLDPRTVRKYAIRLGGVEVIPGRWAFFENRVKEALNACALQTKGRVQVACPSQGQREGGGQPVVRDRTTRRPRIPKGNRMGGGDQETAGENSNRHGLFDPA